MDGQKTPEQLLAEQQAKLDISRRYIDPRANEPEYQDLVDRNRIPTGEQVAPKSAQQTSVSGEEVGGLTAARNALTVWIGENPTGGVLAAAASGFVIALVLFR